MTERKSENSTGTTITRRVQLQYFLAGISGARGPQNDAERILLEEMAQEAQEAFDQSQRLHRLPSTPLLLDAHCGEEEVTAIIEQTAKDMVERFFRPAERATAQTPNTSPNQS